MCVACGCPCVFVLIMQFCYLLPLFDLLKLCPPSSDSSGLAFSLLLPTLSTVQFEGVPQVEFMYLVFTCMPGESHRRRLGSSLLCKH